jgi:hypothetical protein
MNYNMLKNQEKTPSISRYQLIPVPQVKKLMSYNQIN